MKAFAFAILTFMYIHAQAQTVEKINYKINNEDYEGVLVTPKQIKSNTMGVLVIHDWLGLTDKTINKAKDLAALGYVAFAADIYGKGKRPNGQEEAGQYAGKYKGNRKLFREHLMAAYDQLKKVKNVNTSKLSAIGFFKLVMEISPL